jgi:hypothetical protein
VRDLISGPEDVKIRSAKIISKKMQKDRHYSVEVADAAIPPLIAMLSSDKDAVTAQAANTIADLARSNNHNQAALAAAGAIPLLITLLKSGKNRVFSAATWALRNLAENKENQVAIASDGAIPLLVARVNDSGVPWILSELARNSDNQVAIARAGVIPTVVGMLLTQSPGFDCNWGMLELLGNLAENNIDNQVEIAEQPGLISAIVLMLNRGSSYDESTVKRAALVLWKLSETSTHRLKIAEAGVIYYLCYAPRFISMVTLCGT